MVALILIAGLLLPAIPAQAIVGSTTDNAEEYPWVGAAWLLLNGCCEEGWPGGVFPNPIPPDLELGENRVRATGILIAPNVFLTQAGSFRNGRRVAVSIEKSINVWRDGSDYLDLFPGPNPPWHPITSDTVPNDTVYEGYVFHYPGTGDIAAIILDEEVDGPLATLAAPGTLDTLNALKKSLGKAGLTAVSYGPPSHDPETWDFQRRTSEWRLNTLKASTVHLQGPGYFVCDGDQGAPIHDDERGVAALLVFSSSFCSGNSVATGYRLDTQEVQDFLCSLSDGSLDLNDDDGSGNPDGIPDLTQVVNPNYPLLGDSGNLTYNISDDSRAVLADRYCPSASRAVPVDNSVKQSADDGPQQNADRQGKHKAKTKKGINHRNRGKHRR
jgi:hypothetical protein